MSVIRKEIKKLVYLFAYFYKVSETFFFFFGGGGVGEKKNNKKVKS